MAPTIRIDDEVYEWLKKHGETFVDSPNDVLRRSLGLDGASARTSVRKGARGSRRDRIRGVIEEAVAADPDLNLDDSNIRWIHFAPLSWTAPELMRGSTRSGRLLWFMVENQPTRLALYLEICPGDQDTRRRIRESLEDQDWFSAARRQLPPMWHRIFRRDILVPRDYENHGHDAGWIQGRITEMFADFKLNDFPKIDRAVRAIEF